MDELQALSYFSSLTHISRKTALHERSLIKYLGNKWTEYSPEQQEELLDDLCVPHYIRDLQPTVADDDDLPSCWPVLKLPSGEKIIVDENDIWTWRDEHSGPFSWKSKSQQDLTLLDLEPENLTKPHGKGHKSSESDDQTGQGQDDVPLRFSPNHNSWTQAVLEDYMNNCDVEAQTPDHGTPQPFGFAQSPSEEINPAFEGSTEDLSTAAADVVASEEQRSVDGSEPADGNSNAETLPDNVGGKKKSRGLKTPSPKRIAHHGVGKMGKSPGDTSHQLLIITNSDEESHAFTNPAMDVQWSNFVGQSSTDPDDNEESHTAPIIASTTNSNTMIDRADKSSSSHVNPTSSRTYSESRPVVEPPAMVMDRGGFAAGEESVESTPDHTTQLLGSMVTKEEAAEKEEVLYVVDDGEGSVSVASTVVLSPVEPEADPDIPRSGFDFLDNW